jgi:hypothetical protein
VIPELPEALRGRALVTCEELWRTRWLGLGRTATFDAARRWIATDGAEGLPAVRLGRRILVPVPRLLAWLGADGPDVGSEVQEADSR